jgi:hypothetical protein
VNSPRSAGTQGSNYGTSLLSMACLTGPHKAQTVVQVCVVGQKGVKGISTIAKEQSECFLNPIGRLSAFLAQRPGPLGCQALCLGIFFMRSHAA